MTETFIEKGKQRRWILFEYQIKEFVTVSVGHIQTVKVHRRRKTSKNKFEIRIQ